MAYSTIQGCTINKNYYYINVVCIQIVLHWGTNQECSINQGNVVIEFYISKYSSVHNLWVSQSQSHKCNPSKISNTNTLLTNIV